MMRKRKELLKKLVTPTKALAIAIHIEMAHKVGRKSTKF